MNLQPTVENMVNKAQRDMRNIIKYECNECDTRCDGECPWRKYVDALQTLINTLDTMEV